MELDQILKYLLVVVSVLLSIAILLQARGSGLGTVFGGSGGGEFYRSKRGLEAILFNGTILLGILFAFLAIGIAVLNV